LAARNQAQRLSWQRLTGTIGSVCRSRNHLTEPDLQKHTVEVRIGRDEDDRWWVVVIVDTNDNEAVWGGPYEDERPPRKRDSRSPPRLTILMMTPQGLHR
jgi:hypothetical protein